MTKFDVAHIWGSDRACWEFVGSSGSSGGLLLIWNEPAFKLYNCYKGDRWLCLEGLVVKDNFHCAICLVYGPHERAEKISMWEELSYIAGLCQVPVCFLGDFNEILLLEERKGAVTLPASVTEFRTWVNDMELVDLELNDCKYTWFRGQSCSRIDRSLVSVEWLDKYPEMRLRSGSRGLSDHCPLIMEDIRRFDGPRPFRSLDSWFTHEGFLRMVKEEWRGLGNVQFLEKMKALSEPLRLWHKRHFGDMTERIKRFKEEIRKADDMVSSGRYDATIEARRRALVRCCEKWYVRQDMHWKQMSRSRYATEMDRNTRDGLVNRLEREEAEALEALPSVEEVKEAVWDCESSKAPGSDGYNMNFIKRCWDEIGREFTAAVLNFFETASLPTDANVTWVALAPKFIGAKEIKDLRPISMVGCVYKVISKILSRRMRDVMPGLVGESQSAFVKGRKIHDGALIACETVQWLKLKRKASAIIKLDFQKAYDRVKWGFVDIVLEKMGFGRTWRTWVRECVTSASVSILINGSPSKPFKMERGLRQGDPLSPCLFVLVVDVLNRMIGEAVRNNRISPLLVGRDKIELSHLQFADDTILFCPPEEETIRNYKRLLRCFEMMSGLSINFEKSNLIPVNCSQEWVSHMCQILGCQETALPVRYLGISLGANPRLVKTWKPVIEKVEEKLNLWKAKVLSKAGKLVLIKSVINSLPIYYLSLYKMPNAVARRIISLQRKFFWGKDDGRPGMALVKWEMVQAPRKLGGLGVGDAVVRNTALLFKWWWRFSKEDCPLWKRIVCSCNSLNPNHLLSTQILPKRGGPWRDICQVQIKEQQVRQKMIDGLAMEVGDSRATRFWEDKWLQVGKLKDNFSRLFLISNQKGSVIGECGFWDGIEWVWHFQWRRELRHWETNALDQLLLVLQSVRLIADVQDRVVWRFHKEGVYTTNSFVQVLQEETMDEELLNYRYTKDIWKGLVPPRVELFSWFVLVGRVNTKDRLSRLGVLQQNDTMCMLCVVCLDIGIWTRVDYARYCETAFSELERCPNEKRGTQVLDSWLLLSDLEYMVTQK
ncbi:uncharacterized protein LOC130949032 [Arachis stenosperma]|uniref:uncharacterized protein LOC130949032 n=1 Tax=Arachis stenosperma TaxID=217475 RepID=UPI0025ABA1AB|nr:uncharacterized protein LOC130949032 [Arachis stenosperma]